MEGEKNVPRPRLLDLYCGAGIGAEGYNRVGFEVVGIDLSPQPHYPYEFHQEDALEILRTENLDDFDYIHASPPCQLFTRAGNLRDAQGGKSKAGDLLTPTVRLMKLKKLRGVVENVPGAPGMDGKNGINICGSAFPELQVRRHRRFKGINLNVELEGTGCYHKRQGRPWGVYHVPSDSIPSGGRTARGLKHGLEVMGVEREEALIPTWNELKEGIPSQYTEWVGRQLLEGLEGKGRIRSGVD